MGIRQSLYEGADPRAGGLDPSDLGRHLRKVLEMGLVEVEKDVCLTKEA